MLAEDQLYLLSCISATRADVKSMIRLASKFKDSQDFINAVIVFWPEYDDPVNLKFLFDSDKNDEQISDDELIISLINGDSDLIAMVELDSGEVSKKVSAIKTHVENELKVLDIDSSTNVSQPLNWLAKRIIYCNEERPGETLLYSSLLNQIYIDDPDFEAWLNGLIMPLASLNRRNGTSIKIKKFMEIKSREVLSMMLQNDYSHIADELFPYLKYMNSCEIYQLFLDNWFTMDKFNFATESEINTFIQLFNGIREDLQEEQRDSFNKKTLEIIFIKSGPNMSTDNISKFQDILNSIPHEIFLPDYMKVNSKLLYYYFDIIRAYLPHMDLMTLYMISQEKELGQKMHLKSICNEALISSDLSIQLLSQFITEEAESSEMQIFNKLSKSQELSILYESCLSLGKFQLLESFSDVSTDNELELNLLEKYFWQFFKNETNGSSKRPGMIKCSKILRLLQEKSKSKSYTNLEILLEVSDELTNYSMSLGKNILFKPSNILDFKTDPFKIIEIILDKNPKMYKSIDITSSIMEKLFVALDMDISRVNGTESYGYNKLLSMHIAYALVNLDFSFAVTQCHKLFKQPEYIEEFWFSVFQVSKYRDPNWVDNETPTEILFIQMRLLSQLLQVCPVEECEIITQQWSELEVEIASRDLVHDKYSFDYLNSKNTVFDTIFT
ncbi:hypothetical protein C6P45_000900 [Maudiozyma exigua]|uniref:Sec39 domain-containing protein n=1 Tax=Maudiozyma exigua TaxID=34358 RepID=A0A9P6W5I4_MAUEX|nr:hypothetical protein C6P45_000900 [Kazachstania exigua]